MIAFLLASTADGWLLTYVADVTTLLLNDIIDASAVPLWCLNASAPLWLIVASVVIVAIVAAIARFLLASARLLAAKLLLVALALASWLLTA